MKFLNLFGMVAVLLIALSGPSYATEFGSMPIPQAPPPPSPPTTFIPPPIITFVPSAADIIDPTVSERGTESNEVTESNCGGTVELCERKGKSEGRDLSKFTINQIIYVDLLHGNNISQKFYKIKNNVNFTGNKINNNINNNINNKFNNDINNSNDTKNSNNYNNNYNTTISNDLTIFPQLNKIVIKQSAYNLLYKIIIEKSKGGHGQIALNDNEKILINGVFQGVNLHLG